MISELDFKMKQITAGGLVFNKHNEILLIYRKNLWDLPKGKLDPNETIESAAFREVVEETGVNESSLNIIKPLISTKYTTKKSGKTIKKKVKWFLMRYDNDDLSLYPAADESIEDAQWISISNFKLYAKYSRHYVKPVIKAYLSLKLNTIY